MTVCYGQRDYERLRNSRCSVLNAEYTNQYTRFYVFKQYSSIYKVTEKEYLRQSPCAFRRSTGDPQEQRPKHWAESLRRMMKRVVDILRSRTGRGTMGQPSEDWIRPSFFSVHCVKGPGLQSTRKLRGTRLKKSRCLGPTVWLIDPSK